MEIAEFTAGEADPRVSGPTGNAANVVDLAALAAAAGEHGAAWSPRAEELDVNLLVFSAGDGVAEHVNADVDVLLAAILGAGVVTIDGQAYPLQTGQAILIHKGARRGTRALGERFAYLTCHRRRPGLWPSLGRHPVRLPLAQHWERVPE